MSPIAIITEAALLSTCHLEIFIAVPGPVVSMPPGDVIAVVSAVLNLSPLLLITINSSFYNHENLYKSMSLNCQHKTTKHS